MRKFVIIAVLALYLLTGCAAVQPPAPLAPLPEQPTVLPVETASSSPDVITDLVPPLEDDEIEPPAPVPEEIAAPAPSCEPIHDFTGQDSIPVPPPPVELPGLIDKIFAENPQFSGSVLVVRGNQIIFCRGYGKANAESGVENTPGTKFLIGSVTKQFTSMAIMQLYEKGLLDINDKLSQYIPDFTARGDITLWNLLTQTSGILDYLNDYPFVISSIPFEEVSQRNLINLVKTKPLKFEPGSKYSYSNTNYLILGYIVEKVSGMSYGDFLSRNIFEPLGMKDTGLLNIGSPPDNMAKGHTHPGVPVQYFTPEGEIIADTANSVKGAYGAGRLYSTVGDLYLWDRALATEKLISKEYIDMMFYPHVPVPDAVPECAYGFGWVIENDPDVGTIVRHTGTLSGFRAYNGMFADRGITVIVLMNVKELKGRESIVPALKQILGVSRLRNQGQENPPLI
jgi:CubicO group peptidase (beta-lactamase class C family)